MNLDAPVHGYLPWFRLADHRYDNTPDGLSRSVRDLATVEPTLPAGRSHQYSDANYMIAATPVEAVTGQVATGARGA